MSENYASKNNVGFIDLLSEKEYIKLLIGKIISRFGNSLDSIAYAWMVYTLTGSKAIIATLFTVAAIPSILLPIPAALYSGYFSKKWISSFCNIAKGISIFTTSVLFINNQLKPWHLFVFAFFNSSLDAFQNPSTTAIYTFIVPKNKMSVALSLDTFLSYFAELIGYISASILISLIGVSGVIILNALTVVLLGFIFLSLFYEDEYIKKASPTLNNFIKDFKDGFYYFLRNKLIWNVCIFGFILNFFFVPFNAMQSPYVAEVLKEGPETLSLFGIGSLLGIILSSMFIPKVKQYINSHILFIFGGVILGTSYIALSVLNYVPKNLIHIALFMTTLIMGMSIPIMKIPLEAAFMTKTNCEFLPRVSSVFNSFVLLANPIGGIILASSSKILPLNILLFICGICSTALFLSQIWNKTLKDL